MNQPLRISTPEVEGTLHVSKALKSQLLLDAEEMRALFDHLPPFALFNVSQPVPLEKVRFDDFLEKYAVYVEGIKQGALIDEAPLRPYFSALLATDPSALYAQEVAGGRVLVRPLEPVVQLQGHHFLFSEEQKKFLPAVRGQGSITWGIQISCPQLYQDPKTQEVKKVERDVPNAALYHTLARWLRSHTLPTPFLFEGERLNAPIRLGKRCFAWINNHPQLNTLKVLYDS
ncbi:MAG: hypothetical protein K940chlam2_01503 [Chlamydiae bacterium]|nr:hypothetical protein [Chlamydiota bacterium]